MGREGDLAPVPWGAADSTELRVIDPEMVQTVKLREPRRQRSIVQQQQERWVLTATSESKVLDWCW